MASRVTDQGLDRIVNFSDGTVAIALTLLILPLVDIAPQIKEHGGVDQLLRDNWAAFLAFGISFAVIALFWMVHHRVFEGVAAASPVLVRLNFVWLASIVLLPFSTNVLSYSPDANRGVYALYIATLIVTSTSMLAMELVLKRTPGLLRPGGEESLEIAKLAIYTGLLAAALVLAVAIPAGGMLWLLLLALTGPMTRALDHVR